MKMIKNITLIITVFFLTGCTKKIIKRVPSSFEGRDVNVQFIKSPQRNTEFLKVINLLTSSSSYGFWMNQTLNGSGTTILRNPAAPESQPKQLNRVLSLFDLYFTHGVREFENFGSDNQHFLWFYTPMEDFNFINSQEDFEFPFKKEIMEYSYKILPQLEHQVFKKFDNDNFYFDKDNFIFKENIRKKMISEQKSRVQKNWETILVENENPSDSSPKKIDAYRRAFSPIAVFYELKIKKKNNSYQNIRLLLPGPSTIEGLETRDLNKIKIKPGIDITLKKPLVGKLLEMDSISYLKGMEKTPENLANKVMQIDIHKNFKYKDVMNLQISFGSLNPDIGPDLPLGRFGWMKRAMSRDKDKKRLKALPLNTSDRSAALVLDGAVSIRGLPGKKMNKYLGKFRVKTFVHKLGITMEREKETKSFQEAFQEHPTYIMKFNMKRSKLSMRMTKGANSIHHVHFLLPLGFQCKKGALLEADPEMEKLEGYKYTCKGDFATFKEFNEKFNAKFGNSLSRKLLKFSSTLQAQDTMDTIDSGNPDDMFDSGMPNELFKIITSFTDVWEELRKIQ